MADNPNLESPDARPNIASLADTDPLSTEDLYKLQHPTVSIPAPSPELQAYMQQLRPDSFPGATPGIMLPGQKPGSLGEMWNNVQFKGMDVPMDTFQGGKRMKADFRNPGLGNQYFERYAQHPDFEELGFIPFRDNEALYNEHASWWNEMQRASGQWAVLAGIGLRDAFGFGDLTDPETARAYNKAMAIGSSSKGGIGGFTTNLFLNSGYTMGIMGELVLEEAAMALGEIGLGMAAPVTGGASVAGNIALGTRMATRFASSMSKLRDAWRIGKNLAKTLDNLKDVTKARKFFNGAMKNIGNFVNPLENTTEFFGTVNQMKDVSNLVKTYRGFGSFYKDIRSIRLAYGEASLEGGTVQTEIADDLYAEFVRVNGRPPTKEESDVIREKSIMAGKTTSLLNMPAIYFSDKLMFDGLVRGRFNRLYSGTVNIPGTTQKGILTYKKGKPVYEELAETRLGRVKQLVRSPKRMLTSAATYTKANLTEGIQETLQDVIANATKDYYLDEFMGNSTRGGYMNYMAEALREQMSPQGLETFLSGFLMGGMISPISSGMTAITQGKEGLKQTGIVKAGGFVNDQFKRMRWGKDKYQSYKEIKQKEKKLETQATADKIKMLNDWFEDPTKYLSPDLHNMVVQKTLVEEMTKAAKEGREMDFHDYKDKAQIEAISTALIMGRMDTSIKRMEEMKQLTEEEVQQDYKMSKQEFDGILDTSIQRAKKIESAWNLTARKYKNPFNPKLYRHDKERYAIESIGEASWNQAIQELVFQQASFKRFLERTNSLMEEFQNVTELNNIPFSAFTPLKSDQATTKELDTLKKELKAFEESGEIVLPEVAKLRDKKQKQFDLLTAFKEAATKADLEIHSNGTVTDETRKDLFKVYSDYINTLTKEHNDYTTNDAIQRSLDKLIDAYILGAKAEAANQAVNTLLDPRGFEELVNRRKELNKLLHDNRLAEITAALESFREIMKTNEMLQKLADKGMFINPKDLDALINEGKMPKLYSIQSVEQKKEELGVLTEQYQEAAGLFREYLKDIGVSLKDLEIFEAQLDPYAKHLRTRDTNDKRSYEALAKQFGFDPEKPESTVGLKQVLQAVIDSPYSTDYDKELARELLTIASDKETITFVRNSPEPTSYTESRQTVVDSRYAASDYTQTGVAKYPMEYLILRSELQRRMVQSAKEDNEFKKTAEALLKEAMDAWTSLTEAEQSRIAGATKVEAWRGFETAADFVTEAATNEKFQEFLAGVESKTTVEAKSVWQKFIDAVLARLEKIFIRKPTGTLLNATLNLLNTKVGVGPTAATTAAQPSTLSRALSVKQLMDNYPTIANEVLDIFKKFNADRIARGESPLLYDYDKMSDAEIFDTTAFSDFFKNPDIKAVTDLIAAQQRPQGQPVKKDTVPAQAPTVDLSVPVEKSTSPYPLVSDEEYQEFKDTGNVSQLRAVVLYRKQRDRVALTTYESEMMKSPDGENKVAKIKDGIAILSDKKNAPSHITGEMKKSLRDLGFTPAEIKNLRGRVTEVVTILAEGLNKADHNLLENPPAVVKEKDIAEAEAILRTLFNNAKGSTDQVNAAYNRALELIREEPETYGEITDVSEFLKQLKQEAINRIAFDLQFNDLRVGNTVILSHNGVHAQVVEVTKDYVIVELDTDHRSEKITPQNLKSMVYVKYNDALPQADVTEKEDTALTEDEQKVVQETKKSFEMVLTPEAINASFERSKTMEPADALNKLKNNFKCS